VAGLSPTTTAEREEESTSDFNNFPGGFAVLKYTSNLGACSAFHFREIAKGCSVAPSGGKGE